MVPRDKPNLLVTGTTGTGKTKLCEILAKKLDLQYNNVSATAKQLNLVEEYDGDYECLVLVDKDKMLDFLKPIMEKGGNILEYHFCDLFPETWFDGVLVLRCNSTVLYDRLKERDYSEMKIQSIINFEAFQTVLEEAMGSFKREIVIEVENETEEQLEENAQELISLYSNWKATSE